MKNDDLEDLFKKSFENYEAEVSPSVWKNIQVALKWGGLGLLLKTALSKIGVNTLIAVLSSIAAIISTIMVMNWTNKTDKPLSPADKAGSLPISAPAKADEHLTALPAGENKTDKNSQLNNDILKAPVNGQKDDLTKVNNAAVSKNDNKKIESVNTSSSEEPVAAISASPSSGTTPLIVNLLNSGTGKVNKWTYNDGKAAVTGSNPVHVFETPGVYTITLNSKDAAGKTAIDSVKIEVKSNPSLSTAPLEFSPNGDGMMDKLAFGNPKITFAYLSVKIFDKEGKVFYKSDSINAKWDGKDLLGNKAKEGTYFYKLNAEGANGKKFEQKGSINLTR